MLTQLSRYLLQFQQVYIPNVGTLRFVQHPARLDVATKTVSAPETNLEFSETGRLSKHQLWYISNQLHFNEADTQKALDEAGRQLKNVIAENNFTWNGIGTFSKSPAGISFSAHLQQSVLPPLVAERVLRENPTHSVRVGDQVVLSSGEAISPQRVEQARQWSKIVGWAFVILSIFFIIFYLYQFHFDALASGLRQHITPADPRNTYVH